ncbi:MAG: capsid protein [Acutalibacteraceae bacterium]|nr:capsid protein [Acutalibacteraceae bacterium]
MKITEKVRNMIRSWLRIEPAQSSQITINETLDFYGNAIKNSIWYRGKSEELTQLYRQIPSDNTTFWRASSTAGMEIRKIHTGLPKLIVDVLTSVVMADMQDIEVPEQYADVWENIEKENSFKQLVTDALKKTLYIGDGAFKISVDLELTDYPIIEFVSGDRVEYVYKRGRLCEVVFNTTYTHNEKQYLLKEYYGRGYVNYRLFYNNKELELSFIPQTELLHNITYDANWLMAVPLKIYTSDYYEGRGQSIFDGGRTESFDALDEAWSQWMYAVRRSRPKEYLPPNMIPRDPNTGKNLMPNAFDNVYISTEGGMPEDGKSEIKLIQPTVPHDSYLSTYITALDLCLQGLISPSTLGIDTKKLDNAEAQREKEKTTLYTRNQIISVLQEVLPELIDTAIKVYNTTYKQPTVDIETDIPFGEYANPSFESQVETVGKGRTQGIMSVEACVDELYGDTKDDEWKQAEVARIKSEQGVVEQNEPAINADMS